MREGVRAIAADLAADGGGVEVQAAGSGGNEHRYRARFLVDASGRDTFLATRMRTKTPHPRLDRTALSTHWSGAKYAGGIEEGLLQIVYLGGDKKGWIWAIPIGTDRVSVGVVFDHDFLRSERARLGRNGGGDWLARLYRQELFSSPYVAEVLAEATPIQPLMVNGDYSYSVSSKFGPTHAMVGDASAFIDPIFASGVFLSMNSGRLVADALDTILSTGDGHGAMASAFASIDGAYALVDKAIRMFYEPVAINFAQAGHAAELMHRYHENAMAVGHFLLAGDFFEHHERYYRFLDLLADPQLLRLYRSSVIERPEFLASTCDVSRQAIFAHAAPDQDGRR